MDNAAFDVGTAGNPWERVLAVLRPEIGQGQFTMWFQPTRFLSSDGATMRVGVPNEMFAEWMRTQFSLTVKQALPRAGVGATVVEFVSREAPSPSVAGSAEPARTPTAGQSLNSRYTFENFVVSSCNQFAHAAAQAVSEQPGGTYNPLFLYGGVGLGKTHLMQAIGSRFLQGKPDARLRYLTSEQFMNELIEAIRFESTPRFRERCRSVDVLLIDDIQFLAGKESTQEEFFHTFNTLYDAGRQIVITSDCPPRSIPALEERLRSRFEWGLQADIQPPDLETKVAILNKMAATRGWSVPSDVALFVAGQINSNIRELEGCLTTLYALSSIRRRPIDLDLAREVVRSLIPSEKEPVSLETVLTIVARHFGLKVVELKSRTNAQRIAYPRQIAMYLGKTVARESLPMIGQYFGGKHHTTVLHAVRKIENLRRKDLAVNKTLMQLEEQVR